MGFRYKEAWDKLHTEASPELKAKIAKAKVEPDYKDANVDAFVRQVILLAEAKEKDSPEIKKDLKKLVDKKQT